MTEYITLNELAAYKGYGLLNRENMEYLVSIGEIEFIVVKKRRLYSKASIEQHINQVNEGVYKEYYSLKKAVTLVTGTENYIWTYFKRFKNLLDTFNIPLLENKLTFKPGEQWIVKKSDINNFLSEYSSIPNFYNEIELDITLEHFVKLIKDSGIEIIKFGHFFMWQFVKRGDLKKLVLFQKTHHVKSVRRELGIPTRCFEKVLKTYKISTKVGLKFTQVISDSDYKRLFRLQKRELEKYRENYLNYTEIKQLFLDYGYKRPRGEILSTFEKVDVPDLIRVNSYKGVWKLYNKKQIMDYLNERAEYKNVLDTTTKLKYQIYDDYLDLFKELLKAKDVFIDKDNETISFWLKYCERLIMKTKSDFVEGIVVNLCNATLTLLHFLRDKEITSYSTKEINMGIFNSKDIPVTHKAKIFAFFRLYNAELKKKNMPIIDVKSLNIKRKSIAQLKKDSYTSEEYHSILKHISNFTLHFRNSLEDFEKRGINSDYADYWLYVLLHLNNAWRSSDIRKFKYNGKSLLARFNINSIDDLYKLSLSEADIEKVFYSYVVQEYFHSKNDAETELRISNNLRSSFAYCVIFLEWKNINLKESTYLIKFQSNNTTMASLVSRNKLFETIFTNFKFESRKFNRTLLSLVDETSKIVTGGQNVFVSKVIRGHVSEDTTYQHYLNVTQDRLDSLTLDVFDYGAFGYVYKKMVSNLFDDLEWNNRGKEHVKNFRESIGEIYEIEQVANQINLISEARKKVDHEISSLNKNQIKSILNNISLGLNPSKQKNVQCLFKLCVEPDKECDLCPFSIPNMYSYVTITKRFYRTLIHYLDIANDRDIPIWEKKRQYNLLVLDLEIVLEGASVFGEAYIESIIEEDFEDILIKLQNIGEPIFIEGDVCY
ncbi:hypothetical protein [Viridibacillus arvi]|uniref:hypothetical protein n=1 Tax=Viridibacillus arvi TaxID=263475 RepID=UPI003D078352